MLRVWPGCDLRSGRDRPTPVVSPLLRALAYTVLGLSLSACGTPTVRVFSFEPEALRIAVAERANAPVPEFEVPFLVNEDDVARARKATALYVTTKDRARALASAIKDPHVFGIAYEPTVVRTARQAIDEKRGDCLGVSSAFVGLAREIGIKAFYLDASDRVNTLQNGDDMIISSGHVSAVVIAEQGPLIVDFDNQIRNFAHHRMMDDVQAMAHYFNNHGFELLNAASSAGAELPWAEAREQFFIATQLNASLARAWNNLAIAEKKLGNFEKAELYYRVAIDQDAEFAEPRTNLGLLYLAQGRVRDSLKPFKAAIELSPDNPYVYFNYSLALARSGRTGAARAAAEQAVRLDPEVARHRRWLDELYGRPPEASSDAPDPAPESESSEASSDAGT